MRYMSESKALRLIIRCDAIPAKGVGHLARQLALAEEFRSRGHHVIFVGDFEVEWAKRQLASWDHRPAMEPAELVTWCSAHDVDAVLIDGYDFPAELGSQLQRAGIATAAMVDGQFGAHQDAQLYLDQNLDAAPGEPPGIWLTGTSYTLLRDVVRSRRGQGENHNEPPRVLVVFGGTDPFGGSPLAVELLLATGCAVSVVVISANPEIAAQLAAIECGPGQSVEVLPPQDDLPGLAVTCDAAVSAAGSTVWELACLGVPTAMVCVIDNQRVGYDRAIKKTGLGLGPLDQLRNDPNARSSAVQLLTQLLSDPESRHCWAQQGRELIDGDGRSRVADALEKLIAR